MRNEGFTSFTGYLKSETTEPTNRPNIWDRIKGLILRLTGKLNFFYHGKRRLPWVVYPGEGVDEAGVNKEDQTSHPQTGIGEFSCYLPLENKKKK